MSGRGLEAAPGDGDALTRALFVPGDRYGWFARDVASEVHPYQGPSQPTLQPEQRHAHQALAAAVAADAVTRRRNAVHGALWLLAPLALGIAWYLGYKGDNPRAQTGSTLATIVPIIAGLEVVVALLVARAARVSARASERLRDQLAQSSDHVDRELPARQDRWKDERYAWEDAEWRRVLSRPQHVPVGPSRTPRRTDIVGGDRFGWQCLLTTLGSSMLATGSRLEVLDLTERGAAAMLADLARDTAAVDAEVVLLPDEAPAVDLFDGLDAAAVTSVLIEALGAQEGDRAARLLDQRILAEVTRCLAPPLTPARLTLALGLLLRSTPTEQLGLIGDEELDALQNAFGEDQRAALRERLTLLEAALHPLASYGSAGSLRRGIFRPAAGAGLHCIALTGTGVQVVNELLLDLVVQGFARRLTAGAAERPGVCAAVLGAERVAAAHLAKLDSLSAAQGFRVVLFFDSLSEEVAARAVHGTDVLGIMRLTNHSEAERASALIGSGYKLIFTAEALTESRSESINWGTSSGTSGVGPLNVSKSEQENSGFSATGGTPRSGLTAASTS